MQLLCVGLSGGMDPHHLKRSDQVNDHQPPRSATFLPRAALTAPSQPLSPSPKLSPPLVPPLVPDTHHTHPSATWPSLPQPLRFHTHINGTGTSHHSQSLQQQDSLQLPTQCPPQQLLTSRISICLLATDPFAQPRNSPRPPRLCRPRAGSRHHPLRGGKRPTRHLPPPPQHFPTIGEGQSCSPGKGAGSRRQHLQRDANSSCSLIMVTCCLMYAPPQRRCISLISI